MAQSVPLPATQIQIHVPRTVCSVQCTLYSMQCALCNSGIIKLVLASVRGWLKWPALADQMPRTQGGATATNVMILVYIGVFS